MDSGYLMLFFRVCVCVCLSCSCCFLVTWVILPFWRTSQPQPSPVKYCLGHRKMCRKSSKFNQFDELKWLIIWNWGHPTKPRFEREQYCRFFVGSSDINIINHQVVMDWHNDFKALIWIFYPDVRHDFARDWYVLSLPSFGKRHWALSVPFCSHFRIYHQLTRYDTWYMVVVFFYILSS